MTSGHSVLESLIYTESLSFGKIPSEQLIDTA